MERFKHIVLGLVMALLTGSITLHAQAPFGILILEEDEICEGDSVQANIIISGGQRPWTLIISDMMGVVDTLKVNNSPTQTWLKPTEFTEYEISYIEDALGVVGASNSPSRISVKKNTPVELLIAREAFFKNEGRQDLSSSPAGASFFGNGIVGGYFYPSVAGAEKSPHTLSCTYVNENGCTSSDSKEIFVLHGEADMALVLGTDTLSSLCEDDLDYELRGSNPDGLPGLFTIQEINDDAQASYIEDSDSSDNLAVLRPLDLRGSYNLIYTVNFKGLSFEAESGVFVNDLDELDIVGLPGQACTGNEPYALSPGGVSQGADDIFRFTGAGISGDMNDGFFFDPGADDVTPGEHIIALEYSTGNGCFNSVEDTVEVNYSPEVSFTFGPVCLPAGGGEVEFLNTSQGKDEVESWEWDFGDPASGSENSSTAENPVHFYSAPGSYTMVLNAYTANGCISTQTRDTVLSGSPVADFSWHHNCFEEGEANSFISESRSGYSTINELKWTFRDSDGAFLGSRNSHDPDELIEYSFSAAASYIVELEVTDESGCSGEREKSISLRPSLTPPDEGYLETFNQDQGEWKAMDNSSWTYDLPDFVGHVTTAGNKAWYTDFSGLDEEAVEESWVESPCFDLGAADKPVFSMDILRSFRPGLDGAVLQYNPGDGSGWTTLGQPGSGSNWYNIEGLENEPGGSSFGWGLENFDPDEQWLNVVHDMSVLSGLKHVKLRVIMSSSPDTQVGNQGMAFDNISISEDVRVSVLEHFTNAADADSKTADDIVDAFAWKHRSRMIDVQYHTDFPGDDPMNENNPGFVSTRSFVYGIPSIPYAVLNGEAEEGYRYDFSSAAEQPDDNVLMQESLVTASFDLDVQVDWGSQGLEASVTASCKQSSSENLQLYVLVMERLVTAYTGENGDVSFQNVVLDMLPSAGGTLLGSGWSKGDEELSTFSWDYAAWVEDVEDLALVAFITDRDQGNILNAGFNYHTPLTGRDEDRVKLLNMQVFPNPAGERAWMNLGQASGSEAVARIHDLDGRLLKEQVLAPGYQIIELDLGGLSEGLYFISWIEGDVLKARTKVLRTN